MPRELLGACRRRSKGPIAYWVCCKDGRPPRSTNNRLANREGPMSFPSILGPTIQGPVETEEKL